MKSLSFADRVAGSAVSFADGLGDRVHAIDQDGCPIEVLWLRPEFTDVPAFEPALHERTARVSTFHDSAFARVRRLESASPQGASLAVVSERVEGRRLSAVLQDAAAGRVALTFDAAMAMVRQLLGAIGRLHAHGRDVAHGALAPERLIVNSQGELLIVEHVLGPSIEQLLWSRRRLWLDLRIAMPPTAGLLRFDQRADLVQAGATALALVLGRPLRDEDYPDGLTVTLREASDRVTRANPSLATGFAGWLVRALQIEGRSFGSAKEALAALEELMIPASRYTLPRWLNHEARVPSPTHTARQPAVVLREPGAQTIEPRRDVAPVAEPVSQPAPTVVRRTPDIQLLLPVPPRRLPSWRSVLRIAAVFVALEVITVAGTMRYLSRGQPATATPEAADPEKTARARGAQPREKRPVAPTPVPATPVAEGPIAGTSVTVTPPPAVAPGEPDAAAAVSAPAAVPEPGWVAIKAPVDMTIYEGGTRLGDLREGRIALASGAHEIEIVNETLNYRETRRVEVQPAQETVLTINLPFGVVDLNATPWAEVWLDGVRLGETPIGSLSVPLGPHEFVFRHPELGERRYAVSLTAGEPIRLSVDMTRR